MGGVHLPVSIKKVGKGKVFTANHNHNNHEQNFFMGQGQQQTVWNGYKSCSHSGDSLVWEHEGKKLFASSWQGLKEDSGKWDLIIDLAGNIRPPAAVTGFLRSISPKRFKVLETFVKHTQPKPLPSEVLGLDWPDMGVAPVAYDFWVTLWSMLPATTVIACQGGHGRTGTCLAVLMIVNGVDYYSAVEEVRKVHCDKAIESLSQMKYLHTMYVEFLTRAKAVAASAGDTKEVADIEADLEYADKHQPVQSGASKGGSWGQTKSPHTIPHHPLIASDVGLTEITINGKKCSMQCVLITCPVAACVVPEHMGWVEG